MKTYIGIKQVQARPQWRDEGPTAADPFAQRGKREGYEVRYPDGYVSWSPKDVFEAAYAEVPEADAVGIVAYLAEALEGTVMGFIDPGAPAPEAQPPVADELYAIRVEALRQACAAHCGDAAETVGVAQAFADFLANGSPRTEGPAE